MKKKTRKKDPWDGPVFHSPRGKGKYRKWSRKERYAFVQGIRHSYNDLIWAARMWRKSGSEEAAKSAEISAYRLRYRKHPGSYKEARKAAKKW